MIQPLELEVLHPQPSIMLVLGIPGFWNHNFYIIINWVIWNFSIWLVCLSKTKQQSGFPSWPWDSPTITSLRIYQLPTILLAWQISMSSTVIMHSSEGSI